MFKMSYGELENILSNLVEAQIAISRIVNVQLFVGDHIIFSLFPEGPLECVITNIDGDYYAGHAVNEKKYPNCVFMNCPRRHLIPLKVIKGKIKRRRHA
ncbi:MAG: hypothetical protein PHY56_00080 [Candidatus Omnitrophica bacterium]|nr:hypothetical protein [Candidatus Omnitrophota bacterium]